MRDLTPRFLNFYDSATALPLDPEQRWALWKQLYDFAAVPPTPFGQELARRLLDSAWTRYPAALPAIRRGVLALELSPDSVLRRVVDLLGCGSDVRIRLVVFVGGVEGNAFAFGVREGRSGIAVPVEAGEPAHSVTHEFVHAVHRDGCVRFRSGYDQSLAELVVTEGLAMRATEQLLPGRTAEYYTSAAPGWLTSARRRRDDILRGIHEHLTERGPATVQRFTFGTGAAGLSREAYYAGWEVVGALRDQLGMSLHEIATTDPEQYPELVGRAIQALVGRP